MRYQDLHQLLRRRPFKPFTIHTTAGQAYEVRRPELALLGRHWFSVGIQNGPHTGENGEPVVADRAVDIDLPHVVRVEKGRGPEAASGEAEGP